jgi:dimethylamine/trimethylamine dehydrogenase
VVVATGSHYLTDAVSPYDRRPLPVEGFRGSVLTPEEVMSGEATLGHRVLLWDTDGYFVGPGIAEHLAALGHEVTAVTPASAFGPYLHYTMEDARTTLDLRSLGVRIFPGSGLGQITADSATIETLAGPVGARADSIVVVGQRAADSELYRELEGRRSEWDEAGLASVFRVGDCVRPSFIADAIFSGHRLAREIDSLDPDDPEPYIRERRLLEATEADFTFAGPAAIRAI